MIWELSKYISGKKDLIHKEGELDSKLVGFLDGECAVKMLKGFLLQGQAVGAIVAAVVNILSMAVHSGDENLNKEAELDNSRYTPTTRRSIHSYEVTQTTAVSAPLSLLPDTSKTPFAANNVPISPQTTVSSTPLLPLPDDLKNVSNIAQKNYDKPPEKPQPSVLVHYVAIAVLKKLI